MNKTPSLLIAAAFAVLTVAVWGYANRSTPEPAWPAKVRGFSSSRSRSTRMPSPATCRRGSRSIVTCGCCPARRTPCAPTARSAPSGGSPGSPTSTTSTSRSAPGSTSAAAATSRRSRTRSGSRATTQRGARLCRQRGRAARRSAASTNSSPTSTACAQAIRQPVSTAEPWHVWLRTRSSPSMSTSSPCTCCPTGKA